MSAILEICNVRKDFKEFSLKNISFSLEKGYIMGFIGPNGAGKSTTIKLILNLLKKDGGEIRVFGLDHLQQEQEIKNRVGVVLDENHFYDELTVSEMKRVVAPFYKKWDNGLFEKYVKTFELPTKRKIKDLSKGMKMKFSLAIALSHNAELLIMDEPTSGLDPLVRSELLDILTTLMQDEGKGVFFSTHITSDLDKVADYVTLIDHGQILLSTTKDNIFDNYCMVKGPKELLDENARKVFIGIRENSFGFEALTGNRKQAAKMFQNKAVIERPTLEDVMLYHTRGNGRV